MALRKTMPMAPGTRPDPKHETVYSNGGYVRPQQPSSTPGAGNGSNGRLPKGGK
ncbi:hypothetical protein [Streptomyces chryseus]|uniref:Uncharacterized protein n=1 Tax=Streptomyces chryseus TaxID=68186 RepID=A0ABQ3E9X0_9ACTN|nr:hypothetical protein [Streptomyces chryseus]GHB31136.1 hypothetical protein GCM10010346_63150 [Streptomyces chryseus]